YEAAGGQIAGRYGNGHAAAIHHQYGQGKALLIGTFPGAGYYLHHSPEAREFFAGLLRYAGIEQQVRSADSNLQARLHMGPGGNYLWVVNPTRGSASTKVTFSAAIPVFHVAEDIWGNQKVSISDREVTVSVPPR